MSLAGLVSIRGSTCTVRRATQATLPDSSTGETWATARIGVAVLIQPITADIAQRVFGQESTAMFRGSADVGADIRNGDGLLVTKGPRLGDAFRVIGPKSEEYGSGSDHLEVGLVQTTETFA